MPGLDGRGPRGLGPATGGGFGYCTGYTPARNRAPTTTPARGAAGGGRRAPGTGGRGRGRMNVFYATGMPGWARNFSPADAADNSGESVEALESEARRLEGHLAKLRERIEGLRK